MHLSKLQRLAEDLSERQDDRIISTSVVRGELVVEAVDYGIAELAQFLKSDPDCKFSTLVDITAVDRPGGDQRFEVVYHFLSMELNQRVRVRIGSRENETVPSIVATFPAANWFEREVFDMYGILFSGHPDLRRLLTDYGFSGHPLRKDFPVTGYSEVRYDNELKRVVYEPVELVQEYRSFDFMSPWEGADYILPGQSETESSR